MKEMIGYRKAQDLEVYNFVTILTMSAHYNNMISSESGSITDSDKKNVCRALFRIHMLFHIILFKEVYLSFFSFTFRFLFFLLLFEFYIS